MKMFATRIPVAAAKAVSGASRTRVTEPQPVVSEVDDPLEHEADRIAGQVMRMSLPERGETAPRPLPPVAGGGLPLDTATRAFFEPRFGHDFGAVRVHTDDRASKSAEALGAMAFTNSGHISFRAGQYDPRSANGKLLLAHELTHVVQQAGARAAGGMVFRKVTKDDEAKKAKMVAHHKKQQQLVVDFLKKAQALTTDPKEPLAGDNLFRNTAELVNTGKANLFVLTPTHYSSSTSPMFFDVRVPHPQIGGDYPVDPSDPPVNTYSNETLNVIGLERPGLEAGGTTTKAKTPSKPEPITTTPPKEEISPGERKEEAPPKPKAPATKGPTVAWSLSDIKLYTPETPISEGDLKNTFVHEGQHVADLSRMSLESTKDWEQIFELYKTEFRAFWIQPPNPSCAEGICLAAPDIDRLPAPTEKPDNTRRVDERAGCTVCSPTTSSKTPAKGPAGTETHLRNKRQEKIFWHLIDHYQQDQFDCYYTCSKAFRDAVDAFEIPESVNLINSARLLELNLTAQKLERSMKRGEVAKTGFAAAVEALDAVDWAFLRQQIKTATGKGKASKPFWTSLKGHAPDFVYKAMEAWASKEKPPEPAEIRKVLPK